MHNGKSPGTRPARPRKETLDRPRGGDETQSVLLTRKHAEVIDGVDLRDAKVGDRLNLSPHDAEMLIAEGWAERVPQRAAPHPAPLAHAADRSTGSRSLPAEPKGDKSRRKKTART